MRIKAIRILLSLLVVLLCFVIFKQGLRIEVLESTIAELKIPKPLQTGLAVPDFRVKDLAGRDYAITFGPSSRAKVIYAFRPSCGWCRQNSNRINWLASHIATRYDVIGLALDRDGLSQFLKSHHMSFPVYTDVPASAIQSYQLTGVPETIVVSGEGIVMGSWIGAYENPLRPLVESFFSVQLPS